MRSIQPTPMIAFAAIWTQLPKVVFSSTLRSVGPNARLAGDTIAAEIAALRAQPDDGDIAVGGAGRAAEATRLGLIDDDRLFLYPVVIGGGTPFFPPLDHRIDLELVEDADVQLARHLCALPARVHRRRRFS
jgi:dihydrofolate reductase